MSYLENIISNSFLVKLFLTLLSILGTYWFGLRLNYKKRKKEKIVKYLIESYIDLAYGISQRPLEGEVSKKLEKVVANIQLFGTKDQIKMIHKIVNDLTTGDRNGSLDNLLHDLRDSLRKELGLKKINDPIAYIRDLNN